MFDRVSLTIARGQVTGLLGPSGCGKTTLMRTFVGVQASVHGEVLVLGEPAGSKSLRREVAYATQAASVYDDLTVMQNLRYFARVLGAPRGDAERVLELVGLNAHATQRVESLSGGQRSRVYPNPCHRITRAAATQPRPALDRADAAHAGHARGPVRLAVQ